MGDVRYHFTICDKRDLASVTRKTVGSWLLDLCSRDHDLRHEGIDAMIHCYVILCLVASPHICKPPIEVTPDDGRVISSPQECGVGGLIYFASPRMSQQTPQDATPAPAWFPKVSSRMEGDGSDIIKEWVAQEKARAAMQEMIGVK